MITMTNHSRYNDAVDQLRASMDKYFYPDGETLRTDIPNNLRGPLEEFVGHTLETTEKDQLLRQAYFMGEQMESFFHDYCRAVIASGETTPFYSEINTQLEKQAKPIASKPVRYDSLMATVVARDNRPVFEFMSHGLSPEMAEPYAQLLASRTTEIATEGQRAQLLKQIRNAPPPSPADIAWEKNGERALQRASDPSHTRAALEAITEGRYEQFRRDTTPAGIREARAAASERGNSTER